EPRVDAERGGGPALRRADVLIDGLVVHPEDARARVGAEQGAERAALEAALREQDRRPGGGRRDQDGAARPDGEAGARAARLGIAEAAGDARRARAVEDDVIHRRTGEHVAAALEHLGDIVDVGALLARRAAALEALPRALAVAHVADHVMRREA